jgi:trk system potassium uptake protein TrkA
MAALLGDRVEVMEAEAVKGSRLVSGELSEVSLPRGVLVGALRRNGALLVPRGTDRVEPGERVLIIAATESAAKLTDFLTP